MGDTFEEYLQNLEKVLQRCRETNLLLSNEKCFMIMTEGIVLGHHVSAAGIKVDPAKIEVIVKLSPPTNRKGVRSFLGHARYYRRFVQNFTKVASPLFKLLTKESEFHWNDECQVAFDKLKEKLYSAPVLRGPDWKLPFHISIDASDSTIGVVLGQKEDPEFDITVVDRPGKENQVADFLSRLNHIGEDVPVDDDFPDEFLFAISIKMPWFADMANYLAIGKFPPHFSPNHKKRIIRKSADYSWIKGDIFVTGSYLIIHRCVR
eukprot:PITA_11339